ncbi:MAG: ribosome assembly factor SBDS [Candidatus ainarchaeum sp.]|nr:ribosome assembly factor SBDS [Candidatus ainarchaeum sp.]
MVSLDDAVIARISVNGKHFELFVDPDAAFKYKTGAKTDLSNILVVEEVFEDARKGERHTEAEIKKAFQTTDINKIAEIMLKRGEVPVTTEQKKRLLEEKQKKIVAIIAREAIDPRTGAPHPPQRIERAMEEARVRIDEFKDAEAQIEEVLKELRPILPLKFEKVKVAARIPAEYANRIYGAVKQYGIRQEEWQKDGSLIVVVEMPAGMQGEFYGQLNKLTAGSVETKVVK